MISKSIYKKLTWIDLESPTREEIESLSESLDLSTLVTEELRTPFYRSKVERHSNFIYLVLHFPMYSKKLGRIVEHEVDFVIGRDYVMTVHYEPVEALIEFSKLFEINSALDRGVELTHGGFLFFQIIQELYNSLTRELDTLDDTIHDIERRIFEGKESAMVGVISNLNRTLVDFKQAIRFHQETLISLETVGGEFFGASFTYYLNTITGEYRKIQKTIDDHKEILRDLRETNDSLLTSKTNDIITKLTIMNFVMLPLGLITWVFAMHTEVVYIKDTKDFMLVLLAMALTGLVIVMYFRSKKWL